MPTTTYSTPTASVAAIGGRTDSSGEEVPDYTAEEARFVLEILEAGYLKPAEAWQVRPQASPNMSVRVGSGTAKADHYVVEGRVAGQGRYIVRLDAASVTLSVPAADASQPRTDEVYLVVLDNSYDATTRGLPQLGYRRGDLGGAAPGPDSGWEAYAYLGTVQVAAGALSITSGNITDHRAASTLVDSLLDIDTDELVVKELFAAKGDLVVGTADGAVSRLARGTNGQRLVADTDAVTGLAWTPAARVVSARRAVERFTTSSSTMANVAAGFSASVEVGASGFAIVVLTGLADNLGGAVTDAFVSFAMSGANTGSDAANQDLLYVPPKVDGVGRVFGPTYSKTYFLTGLNPGSTTFTPRFRSASNGMLAGVFNPEISVLTF